MKKLLTTLTVSAIAVAGFSTYAVPKADAATFYKVKVMNDGLRARTGPATTYGIITGLDKGDTYKYLGRTGNWTKILYGSRKVYVSSTYVKKYSVTTSYKIKIMADNLRVRSSSSTSSSQVGTVNSGQTFRYLGRTGDWIKFLYNGNKRFVHADYVKKYTVTSLTNSGGATKASNDFITPTSGPITQGYGQASGVYGYTFHNGIDYGAPKGTPVYATAAGKVITSQLKGAYGNYVMVKHSIDGASFTSLYAHMNSRSVSVGQSVSKGQLLGTVGQTGNAFGTHLHFELHRGTYVYSATSAASSVNPLNYL